MTSTAKTDKVSKWHRVTLGWKAKNKSSAIYYFQGKKKTKQKMRNILIQPTRTLSCITLICWCYWMKCNAKWAEKKVINISLYYFKTCSYVVQNSLFWLMFLRGFSKVCVIMQGRGTFLCFTFFAQSYFSLFFLLLMSTWVRGLAFSKLIAAFSETVPHCILIPRLLCL